MSDDEKGLGSKLLGLVVQTEDEPKSRPTGQKSAADLVAEIAGSAPPGGAAPMRADFAPPPLKLEAAPSAAAPTDFETIFREAGMDAAELDRVKKAEELLKSLPEATPNAVKKQIVEASLKAFGFEIEKIVLAAHNQKRALDAYVKVNENATAKAISDAEAQIKSLNEKIAALRAEIEKRTANLSSLTHAAHARKAQVQKVSDFFQAPTGAGVAPPSAS